MKKVVGLLTDLMFTVKIVEAAKKQGLEAVLVKSADEAIEQAKTKPAIIFLDLNATALEPLRVIERLKSSDETRDVYLVGFVSHVQAELRAEAQKKGCDAVLARSAFSQNLPGLLDRFAKPV